jgi:hypothetical protein
MNVFSKSAFTMGTTNYQQVMQAPNVIGYVLCSDSGDIVEQEGNEVAVLATVLVYFQQVSGLIGESFGLEDFQEAQIQSKSLTVLCVPHQGGAFGVILSSRLKINEVIALVRQVLAAG